MKLKLTQILFSARISYSRPANEGLFRKKIRSSRWKKTAGKMVRTRGECREQKVTLAQSHRVAVAGKVLHILYLKGARRPQPLSAEHVRVREYARAHALSPSRTRAVLALLSSRDRSHLNLPAMRVVRARFSMCSALMIPSYQKEDRNRIGRA